MATKYDEGKARLDLIPPEILEVIAKVYGMGAIKYEPNGWRDPATFDYSRLYSAGQRHRGEFWKGNDLDEESGLPHLAHSIWNDMALLYYSMYNLGTDDRFKAKETEAEFKVGAGGKGW